MVSEKICFNIIKFIFRNTIRVANCMDLDKATHFFSGPTHRRAIKEESNVFNRDWIDHKSCSLSKYISVIPNPFIMRNYFTKLRCKSISANHFLNFLAIQVSC